MQKLLTCVGMLVVFLPSIGHTSMHQVSAISTGDVSGAWSVSAEGYELSMTLRQDGTRLAGTMQISHGAFPIAGEFRKGRIHFAGVSDGGGIRHDQNSNELDVAAIGRLQSDGSLAGTMVSAVGDFTWRAIRK